MAEEIDMRLIAMTLDHAFNGELVGPARHTGFVLLSFLFGSNDGRCNYVSNGVDRKAAITLLRAQADRFEAELAGGNS